MDPLPTTKWMMEWLCMYPVHQFSNQWWKIAHTIFSALIFFISSCGILVHLAYIWEFKLTDLEGSLFALISFVGNSATLYSSIIAFFLRFRIQGVFRQLSMIYDISKYFIFSILQMVIDYYELFSR